MTKVLLDKNVKLNLGCGKTRIPGFINIDSNLKAIGADIILDLNDINKFFENESIELVYMSHILEYYDYEKGLDLLKNIFKLLLPKGIIRIAVPDFYILSSLYLKHNVDLKTIIGPLYGKWKNNDEYIYHKTVYDMKILTTQLETAGFTDIKKWNWRETEHADIDDYSQAYLPHMDKENGILISLNIQGQKV